ncbi:CehA/McbA family metallohydrolase [Candidatus Bathyarchaeota archaeon]|nr:CehA/McbA family metallohydrolase [Candidatus Bathyarchaeota archaeon]
MGLKIDFHVHTCYSHDSSITVKEVVSFAKKRGLDGVAVTDHNTVKGALKLKTRDLLIVPGIEVSTLDGHLLGINVTTSIPAKLGIEETIQRIHDVGGIAVAPHPTAFYKSPPSRSVSSYDAVEVMNASSVPFSVLTYFSKRFADGLGLPQTGGSDSHYAPEIGSAYTVVEADSDVDEIVAAIKRGAAVPMGRGIPWKIRLERTALGLKRKI